MNYGVKVEMKTKWHLINQLEESELIMSFRYLKNFFWQAWRAGNDHARRYQHGQQGRSGIGHEERQRKGQAISSGQWSVVSE